MIDSVYIYYFSGTGNARAASGWVADEAVKRGLKASVQDIGRHEDPCFPPSGGQALIGFAYPTHGFNAAPSMLKFIAGFPRGKGRDVFLLNTRAGMKAGRIFLPGVSGVALLLPAFFLLLKGYRCTGFRPVDLPSNWIILHPGLREKIIESIFLRCEGIVRNFANRIFDGKRVFRGLLSLPIDLAISPIALGYYIGGRFFLAKTLAATEKCNRCGLCIRECPTSSITLLDDMPYWKLSCESCMRCINICPERAIESIHGMAIVFWLVFSTANAWLILLILKIAGSYQHEWYWKILTNLAAIAGMVFVTAVLYRVMHFMKKWEIFRKVIRLTSLSSLTCWRRYRPMSKKTGMRNPHP